MVRNRFQITAATSEANEPADEYLTLSKVAARLNLSTRTIRTRVGDSSDPLPAYRIGGRLLFRWSEVEAWLDRRRVRPVDTKRLVEAYLVKIARETDA